jgi:hypothetical protein
MTGPQPTQAQKAAALDTVMRRYPDLIAASRDLPSKMARSYVAEMMPSIVEDYRRLMVAEQVSHTQLRLIELAQGTN